LYPFEVLLNPEYSGLFKIFKVQAQQIRTISKQRVLADLVGCLSQELIYLVNDAIKLHLGLE
jgi:mRNA interferase MazF